MPLKISRSTTHPPLFEAFEFERFGSVEIWKTDAPIPLGELIALLENRGWHQTDIGDALYEVDPSLIGF